MAACSQASVAGLQSHLELSSIDGSSIYILRYAENRLPAGTVLDEVAFLTNAIVYQTGVPTDESRLHDPAFRVRVANAIENAIRQSWP